MLPFVFEDVFPITVNMVVNVRSPGIVSIAVVQTQVTWELHAITVSLRRFIIF